MRLNKLFWAAALGAASLSLGACSTGLATKVTRFQQAALVPGQTFYVVPRDGQATPGFYRYASIVAQQLESQGFRAAGAPNLADMLVRVDYGVDEGKTEYVRDPFYGSPGGFGYGRYGYGYGGYGGYGGFDPFWGVYTNRPYYSRYGGGFPYYYGWNDPFWYGGYGGMGYPGAYDRYTVYKSFLDMDIVQRTSNAPLFEGHAKARSSTDELDALVPNLIQAMFTGFPGRNGETVKITVPPPRRG